MGPATVTTYAKGSRYGWVTGVCTTSKFELSGANLTTEAGSATNNGTTAGICSTTQLNVSSGTLSSKAGSFVSNNTPIDSGPALYNEQNSGENTINISEGDFVITNKGKVVEATVGTSTSIS